MKYSKRDRALAVRICQAGALNPYLSGSKHAAAKAIGLAPRSRAEILAYLAWSETFDAVDYTIKDTIDVIDEQWCRLDAEAECLLRDGWSPDERVVRLGGAS